jgi:cytochrome oxidase Cu insertion factor (SCO1/SenC/PrrC family)
MKHVSKKAPRKQASRHLFYIVIGFAVGLAGLTGLVYAVMPGRVDLGSPAIGGSFAMIGQDGRVVTNADLAGRPYLVFFGYTHCLDFCPTALFDISAVFKELGPDKKIAALFVTVDPERDTPDILKTYLENFDSRINRANRRRHENRGHRQGLSRLRQKGPWRKIRRLYGGSHRGRLSHGQARQICERIQFVEAAAAGRARTRSLSLVNSMKEDTINSNEGGYYVSHS